MIAVLFAAEQVDQDFTSLKVEAKAHLAEALGLHGAAQFLLALLGVEEEEAASAGAGDLAAERSVSTGDVVEAVDARIGDARAELLLGPPVLVEHLSESPHVSALEVSVDLGGRRIIKKKKGRDGGGAVLQIAGLPGENLLGGSSESRIEKHAAAFEILQHLRAGH